MSLFSFVLLGGFLLLSALRFGVPDMVSDTYYQLQGCKGSGKKNLNYGAVFTAVMILSGGLMMVCVLDTGLGCQPLAFLGCAAMVTVGMTPNYLGSEDRVVHKVAAVNAAMGCVGWCLTARWEVTAFVAGCWLLYWAWSRGRSWARPWFWAEVAGMADVFLTYWTVCV